MGNRICCALSGILYAGLAGRQVHIDWSDAVYSDDGRNVFPVLFEARQRPLTAPLPETDSVHPRTWRGHLTESKGPMAERCGVADRHGPRAWRRTSADLTRLHYPEQVVVFWSYTEQIYRFRRRLVRARPALRGLAIPDILARTLRDELAPGAAVRQRVAAVRDRQFGPLTFGVHARYTDKQTRLDPLTRRVEMLVKKYPGARLFIASDNEKVARALTMNFPGAFTVPRHYAAQGHALHKRGGVKDRLAHATETLVDLYLLAACDGLVIDERSTLSFVARLLSDAPANRVVNLGSRSRLPPRLRHWAWSLKRSLRFAAHPNAPVSGRFFSGKVTDRHAE